MTPQTAALKIGAGPFPPMVEETDFIVRALKRLDFALDKVVEFDQISFDCGRDVEVHFLESPELKAGSQRIHYWSV
jgi:hypothetical protein